jgi:hypothetical protein
LFAVFAGGDSVQDEYGNWSVSEPTNQFVSACLEETNGAGSEIQIAGGTYHVFASLVQLPKGTKTVEAGTSVFVSDNADGSGVRVKGTVLKFDKAQLHSRLWV